MSEDWQHFLTAAVPTLAIISVWVNISGRLTKIETKIEPLWEWWNKNGGKK